ncbi:MAG: heavy-metal-associated domain-containing protein [Planctomycetes bacterium]|nr:heavy-metal-associated domain-containing protein [Planctomycetota bacterium]
MSSVTIPVEGLHCQNCVNAVTKAVSAVDGVDSVAVSLEKGEAVVSGASVDVEKVRAAIDDLGFEAGQPK